MNQGMVNMSRRAFNAAKAFLHVKMSGIHKINAMIVMIDSTKIVDMRLGNAASMAQIDEMNHIHVAHEQPPKKRLAFLRRYFEV